MSHIVVCAEILASAAHSAVGQVRHYTGEPYIVHPRAVATLLTEAGEDAYVVAAGWLHDTKEDTKLSDMVILEYCGPRVLEYVLACTDTPAELGFRKDRKAMDRERLGRAAPGAKSVKLADLIDNTKSIVQHNPKFAKTYLREKELMLPFLVDGNAKLFQLAHKVLAEGQAALVQYALEKKNG